VKSKNGVEQHGLSKEISKGVSILHVDASFKNP
jgi:hypothetical protein